MPPPLPLTPDGTTPAHTLHISACASQRRASARNFLAAQPTDAPALLLVPTPNAGLWLMADALAPEQARFGWRRLSLAQHCHALARPALLAEGRSTLSPVAAQALCARVVLDLRERRALGRFAAIHDRPGFVRALWSTLSELRLAQVTPAALSQHDPELAEFARAFEDALHGSQLADEAALYQLAAARAHAQPQATLLALDVPIEHAAQAELVRAIGAQCERACVTIPLGDAPSHDAWRAALPHAVEQLMAANSKPNDLSRLQARLFEPAHEPTRAETSPACVHFSSCPGESRECVEVARAVLDAANHGVPFDHMAVLVRAVDNYRALLEEAFARADIPAHYAAGVRRPAPDGRAFALLLSCADSGLCVQRFAQYLSLAVMPRSANADAAPPSPRYWERLLIQAQVGGDSAVWRAQLSQLSQRWNETLQLTAADDPQREVLGRRLEALDALTHFAVPLLTRLETLPERASFGVFRVALSELAEQALSEPAEVQALLSQLSPLDGTRLGRRELHQLLSPHLRSLIVASDGSGAGKLQVLPVDEARGRSFERVFVVGMAEKLLPPRLREDPLLPDRVRAQLSAALPCMPQRVARERLALRIAVGAASQQLHLTFPRFDTEQGRPRVPSFYGLEVLEAVDGRLPAWSELSERAAPGAAATLGWPAPEQPEHAIDDAEYDLATIARARRDPAARPGALRYLVGSNAHLARALRFRARRWELQKFVAADGFVVTDPGARELLASYLQTHAHSASALEQLTVCPYRFYLRGIARLAALEPPSAAAEIDARERGVLFHKFVHETLEELAADTSGALDPPQVLDQALQRLRATQAQRFSSNRARLLDVELAALRHDLKGWLNEQRRDTHWRPRASELRFGEAQSVLVAGGLYLTGAIDLVEQSALPDADGHPVLRATDFKTGRSEKPRPSAQRFITAGAHVLQPLLYALALESVFPEARVSGGRLYYCTRQQQYTSYTVELNERAREIAAQFAAHASELLAQGFLPAYPEADGCAGCEYQVICGPHEPERVQRVKQRDRARLRSLALLQRLP